MPEITLTPEQSQIVAGVNESILVRDAAGKYVGSLEPSRFTPEEVEEALRRAAEDPRRYTTAQVFAHLLVLSEAEKKKGARLDPAEVDALLKDL